MPSRRIRHIGLALQGSGAHGAFTWGVPERLLEGDRIEIDAISGTSVGAMNAVVLADGLMADGRQGARESLRRFWSRVSHASGRGPMGPEALAAFVGNWSVGVDRILTHWGCRPILALGPRSAAAESRRLVVWQVSD